jgi:hypothetical protein
MTSHLSLGLRSRPKKELTVPEGRNDRRRLEAVGPVTEARRADPLPSPSWGLGGEGPRGYEAG